MRSQLSQVTFIEFHAGSREELVLEVDRGTPIEPRDVEFVAVESFELTESGVGEAAAPERLWDGLELINWAEPDAPMPRAWTEGIRAGLEIRSHRKRRLKEGVGTVMMLVSEALGVVSRIRRQIIYQIQI